MFLNLSLVQCFSKEGIENQVFPDLHETTQSSSTTWLVQSLTRAVGKSVTCSKYGGEKSAG